MIWLMLQKKKTICVCAIIAFTNIIVSYQERKKNIVGITRKGEKIRYEENIRNY